jgi:hypothetical protein
VGSGLWLCFVSLCECARVRAAFASSFGSRVHARAFPRSFRLLLPHRDVNPVPGYVSHWHILPRGVFPACHVSTGYLLRRLRWYLRECVPVVHRGQLLPHWQQRQRAAVSTGQLLPRGVRPAHPMSHGDLWGRPSRAVGRVSVLQLHCRGVLPGPWRAPARAVLSRVVQPSAPAGLCWGLHAV